MKIIKVFWILLLSGRNQRGCCSEYGEVKPVKVVAYLYTDVRIVCWSANIPVWSKQNGVIQNTKVLSPVLVLRDVTENDNGTYICKGELRPGVKFQAYSSVYVGVRDENRIVPKEIRISTGEIVHFVCKSKTRAVWTYGQGELHNNVVLVNDNKELLISNAELKNVGKYYCYGSYDDYTQHFVASSMLYVYINNQTKPSHLIITELHGGSLVCLSYGHSKWTFNGTKLPSNIRLLGHLNQTLEIVSAGPHNQGYYDCQGFTKEGWIFFSRSHVTVIGINEVKIIPTHQVAQVGDTVKFKCLSHIPIIWKFENNVVAQNDRVLMKSSGNSHYLVISPTQLSDKGWYSCRTLEGKRKSDIGQLVVKEKINIIAKDDLKVIFRTVGENVEFVCKYEDNVVWKHNGKKILRNYISTTITDEGSLHRLKIENLKGRNRGTYSCHDGSYLELYDSIDLIVADPTCIKPVAGAEQLLQQRDSFYYYYCPEDMNLKYHITPQCEDYEKLNSSVGCEKKEKRKFKDFFSSERNNSINSSVYTITSAVVVMTLL